MQTPALPQPGLLPAFRERLWPTAWVFVTTALVIPASVIVFLPIDVLVGVITAVVLYGAIVAILVATSPVISVTHQALVAGRASLPLRFVGAAESFEAEEAFLERGQRLDARAWLIIRGWIGPVVKIAVTDDADATPYWLVSTRRPGELVAALTAARAQSV